MGARQANPSRPMPVTYPRQQVTALILAGGQGRRVGGRDKGLLDHAGSPLVCHVAHALAGQAAQVLLSANRSFDAYRALGFDPLPDLRADFPGPLAGIEAGLAACHTPYLLVCPCDTPDVPADLGERLWLAMQDSDASACYAIDDQRPHYLHLLLRSDAAGDIGTFLDGGGRAVRHWLGDKKPAQATFDPRELANLNRLDGD